MLIEEYLERTIFHTLRKEVVNRGYLPDIYNYDIENNNNSIVKTETDRYNTDLSNIIQQKGFAIEVFNYSTNHSYGEKKPPRIVVQTDSFIPGDIGTDPSGFLIKDTDGSFIKKKSTDILVDFYFTISLVANKVSQMRQLHDIMVNVMPRRGYIKPYDEEQLKSSHNILVEYLSNGDVSFLGEGIMEKVYRYKICDIHEYDDKIISDINIPPIIEIGIDITGDVDSNLNIQ